jgi:hypothetical protein
VRGEGENASKNYPVSKNIPVRTVQSVKNILVRIIQPARKAQEEIFSQ